MLGGLTVDQGERYGSGREPRRRQTAARRHRLGQHFLKDPRVIEKILVAFAPGPGDCVLEVGPGHGALTEPLALTVATFVAVECDASLAVALQRRYQPETGVTILEGDILEIDLEAELTAAAGGPARFRLLGNLPYSIATPLLVRTLARADLFSNMTVMVQREVARRMLARPGSADYGPLAVLVALRAAGAHLVLDAPPGAFAPPPEVHSSVVQLDLPAHAGADDTDMGIALARRAFLQRRKKLVNTLGGTSPHRISGAMASLGMATDARPEQVAPEDYVRLARCLRQENIQ
ncbi:MAG: 16S rRNA (adenine(1518)-N(6)/adenine(1519)-N(6))-dimethyltransferase RsmA [Acidobacteria bacterium]|nr:16S rRNA (adenine(1518)-N(6)/adenine(1519)-N(6))-dimethyltransferase RsmA [Acidobacteriota bacterium]